MEATPTGLFTVFDETAVVWELCSSGEWKHDVAKHAVGTGNTTLAKMIVWKWSGVLVREKITKMIAAQSKKTIQQNDRWNDRQRKTGKQEEKNH